MAYQSTVSIEEVLQSNQGQASAGRKLVLTGPSLPFMGAEWGMRNALVTTWYPGNGDEGTQQTLGPQELPSRWSGDWRRTMLGKSPASWVGSPGGTAVGLVNPQDLRDALELLARAGQRLRVIWSVNSDAPVTGSLTQDTADAAASQTGTVVREGRMGELKFRQARVQDVEWEVEFQWVSRGNETPRLTGVRGPVLNEVSTDLANKIDKIITANQTAAAVGNQPGALTLGQLEAIASTPTKLVNALGQKMEQIQNEVGQLVGIAATLASQPAQVTNRAIEIAQNTVAQLNNFSDTLGQVPYELKSTKSRVRDFSRAAVAFGRQQDLAFGAATAGIALAQLLQNRAQALTNVGRASPGRLANPNSAFQQVYVTKTGDTPQTVSLRFYGSPDSAAEILRANRLSWYTPVFSPGKILIIPVLSELPPTLGV